MSCHAVHFRKLIKILSFPQPFPSWNRRKAIWGEKWSILSTYGTKILWERVISTCARRKWRLAKSGRRDVSLSWSEPSTLITPATVLNIGFPVILTFINNVQRYVYDFVSSEFLIMRNWQDKRLILIWLSQWPVNDCSSGYMLREPTVEIVQYCKLFQSCWIRVWG